MSDFPTDLVVSRTRHRPWRVPDLPWIMTQSWHDLLFLHWPVPPADVRRIVPEPIELDLFAAHAWLGIVPFRMTNVAPRFAPNIPRLSSFDELNVRTYVVKDGKPGIYFFSLDANSYVAVGVARAIFRLPYYAADITVSAQGSSVHYASQRTAGGVRAELDISYKPTGATFEAEPGTLEYFLAERYCLYTTDRRRQTYRLEINHPPWRLQPAECAIAVNTMAEAAGVRLPDVRPLAHFVKRQDMVAWPLTRT